MLGKAVRARRLALGLTQAELAERANVGPQYIARLETGAERGAVNPTLKTLESLAAALELDLVALLAIPGGEPATQQRDIGRALRIIGRLDAGQRKALLGFLETLGKPGAPRHK